MQGRWCRRASVLAAVTGLLLPLAPAGIAAAAETAILDVLLRRTDTGGPLELACADALRVDDDGVPSVWWRPAGIGSQGRIQFEGLAPGRWTVAVWPCFSEPWPRTYLGSAWDYADATILDLQAGDAAEVVVDVDPPAPLVGRVVDADGAPLHCEVAGFPDVAQQPSAPSAGVLATTTDDDGRWTIKATAMAVDVPLRFRCGDLPDLWSGPAAFEAGMVPVRTSSTPFATTTHDLVHGPLGILRGRFVDTTGNPRAVHAAYRFVGGDGLAGRAWVTADDDGFFEVEVLPGPAHLSWGGTPIDGLFRTWFPAATSLEEAQGLDVGFGELLDLGDVVAPAHGLVRGRVVDATDGSALPGCASLEPGSFGWETDGQGLFVLESPERVTTTHVVEVHDCDYGRFEPVTLEVTVGPDEVVDVGAVEVHSVEAESAAPSSPETAEGTSSDGQTSSGTTDPAPEPAPEPEPKPADEPEVVTVEVEVPGGDAVLTEAPADVATTDGFVVLGRAVHVDAPEATPEDPLRLTFRVHPSQLADGEEVTLFRDGVALAPCDDDTGVASPDPCHLPAQADPDGAVTVVALSSRASTWAAAKEALDPLAAACPADVPSGTFVDVVGTVFERPVDCVAWHGIANGIDDDRFLPVAGVSRAQLATFLARLADVLDVDLPSDVLVGELSDVVGTAHESAIRRLAAAGVVGGYPDGLFRPEGLVTRGQAAVMLASFASAAGHALADGPETWFDDVTGTAHESAVRSVSHAGLMVGTSVSTFDPGLVLRRGQMAAVVARTHDLLLRRTA